MGDGEIRVEVAYAHTEAQALVALRLPAGTCAETAIARSGLLERFPEIDLSRQLIGIFGTVIPLTQVLVDGDRVEIYRPLLADPKEVRRRRAVRRR